VVGLTEIKAKLAMGLAWQYLQKTISQISVTVWSSENVWSRINIGSVLIQMFHLSGNKKGTQTCCV
jgi:hypothetical protein